MYSAEILHLLFAYFTFNGSALIKDSQLQLTQQLLVLWCVR